VHTKQKVAKCMVFGDLMLRNVGAEHTDMMVECFQGLTLNLLMTTIFALPSMLENGRWDLIRRLKD
jgi:hypothetical protein